MKKGVVQGTVQHNGTVKKVDSNSVFVRIVSETACSGCHALNLCNISGEKEKIVEVKGKYNLAPGDPVTIVMERSMGRKAIFISYVIPLLILITSLIILNMFSVSELVSGLVSISMVAPYFVALYFLRNRIDRSFSFTLKT
jgi:sigma-E factor negative regulatory protein RseC